MFQACINIGLLLDNHSSSHHTYNEAAITLYTNVKLLHLSGPLNRYHFGSADVETKGKSILSVLLNHNFRKIIVGGDDKNNTLAVYLSNSKCN